MFSPLSDSAHNRVCLVPSSGQILQLHLHVKNFILKYEYTFVQWWKENLYSSTSTVTLIKYYSVTCKSIGVKKYLSKSKKYLSKKVQSTRKKNTQSISYFKPLQTRALNFVFWFINS